jgi:membrane associated rhomboid family serine protease
MATNSFINEIKYSFRSGSILTRLIVINAAVFVLFNLVALLWFLFGKAHLGDVLLSYLAVPSDIGMLLRRPWTIVSYMFLHEGFFHILFNMVFLYFGGRIFSEYLGERRMLAVYILGGIAGALVYILAFNLFPVFENILPSAYALGASASVLAVFVAIAAYVPDYAVNLLLIGRIRLKYVALILVVLDLINIRNGNAGGHFAHLGGALFGLIFSLLLKRGTDMSVGFNRFIHFFTGLFKPRSKLNVSYKKSKNNDQYNAGKKEVQQKIDLILDKISRSGYESLTKEEKDLLFKMSKDNF